MLEEHRPRLVGPGHLEPEPLERLFLEVKAPAIAYRVILGATPGGCEEEDLDQDTHRRRTLRKASPPISRQKPDGNGVSTNFAVGFAEP